MQILKIPGEVGRDNFFSIQQHRTELPREAIGADGSNCFSRGGGGVPDFLRKPIATCDIPEEQGLDPLPYPSGSPIQRIYKQKKINVFACLRHLKYQIRGQTLHFMSSNVFAMSAIKDQTVKYIYFQYMLLFTYML